MKWLVKFDNHVQPALMPMAATVEAPNAVEALKKAAKTLGERFSLGGYKKVIVERIGS